MRRLARGLIFAENRDDTLENFQDESGPGHLLKWFEPGDAK
jgi:hypothetical protein